MEKKQSPNYYSAVVVINLDGQVLLGKRKEDGIWTTPGGGAEPGEMNPSKTASRELFEEAGIPAHESILQPIGAIETRNGKLCHTFLYVCNSGVMTTSKLDPDQEVRTWKWFSMDQIPNDLKDDPRRFESVRNGYMKFHGINKSLIDTLEKGKKPAAVGEVRTFSGKQYQKMGDGSWKPYVHKEEKQLEAEQNKNKVVSLTDKLKSKIEEKKEVSASEQHLSDLTNQTVVPGEQTRSEKPMFTNVDDALAHGYEAADFREVGNFFYDRAQKMADNVAKLKETGQKVDPNFEKIQKLNLRYSKAFIGQANHIDERQAKTKAAVKKSVVMMGHNDGAEINTASFAIENQASQNQGWWLEHVHNIMDGYQFGDVPRVISMDKGDLYLVKVDEALYSGAFKRVTPVEDGQLEDNAKVRIERMTLPSLIQFCLAQEWMQIVNKQEPVSLPEPSYDVAPLIEKLEAPVNQIVPEIESNLDKKIRLMELVNKLIN